MTLKIVDSNLKKQKMVWDPVLALDHHEQLICGYIQSHRIRSHADSTIKKEQRFLEKWFSLYSIGYRPLYTWEAMNQSGGRERILNYSAELLKSELHSKTIRGYLGILKKYFSFVQEFPFIKVNGKTVRMDEFYDVSIFQPISEFDIPHHSHEDQQQGIPFDPESLYDFYKSVRDHYVDPCSQYSKYRARNYTLLVLAGESGMRANELRNLQIEDLFFDSNKIQTRCAKGSRGSGSRSRVSLFNGFAQDCVRYYLKKYRPQFERTSNYLFPTMLGNPISYQAMQKELKVMVKVAVKGGFPVLPHLGWHWMRRIFATRFIERSPDKLSVLIKLLGHNSPNTVHRYIRHSEAWIDKQIIETLKGIK